MIYIIYRNEEELVIFMYRLTVAINGHVKGHLPDELNGLLQQEHHNQSAQIQAEITYFNQTKAFYVEFI